ncbi:MAG: zinc-binding alcohol dehydrogenase family protein [Bacteroidales bacterium]|nr:zinc-binding alcohol dehydrogenase family protein [Bacteroidales bacterium]
MKAINISAVGEIEVVEKSIPKPSRGEVLLKIKYVGFCGSDLNTFLGKNPMVKLPVIPGHEISAVIEDIGEEVPESVKISARCTVNPYTNCQRCSSCRNSKPNACRFNETLGVQRDGAMSEYIIVPWQKVIINDEISERDLTLIEPLSVGFHAVARANVTDTDVVMVIGSGMIGIGAVIRAVLRGASVIAVDVDDKKLQLAKSLGALHGINSSSESLHSNLDEITNGMGPDVVIEAVGAPTTYRTAIDEVAFTGRVVYIGYAKSEVSFETKYFVSKELDIRGSRNALPEDFRAVIDYVKRNGIPDEFVTAIYKPEKAKEALEYWSNNSGNVFRIFIEF